jgi:hypothetical protein
MDGSFACPECGAEVEVRGLAPGRQVRCAFCHRLLEVPYLPRAAGSSWKRRRHARPKWVAWAWVGLCVLLIVVVAAGAVRFLRRQYDSIQDRSINQLLASAQQHETDGRLSEALIDLDAALELADKAGPSWVKRREEERTRRPDLARRDAEAELGRLDRNASSTFRVGDWLNLIARAEHDADLAPVSPKIDEAFQASLHEQTKRELATGRQFLAAGNLSNSMDACDRLAALVKHLSKASQAPVREETRSLVEELVKTAGILVDVHAAEFVYGSSSYVADMTPVLEKALESKGYLPRRGRSDWRDLWRDSPFQARLDVSETKEGNYLSSENRLTLIHAELTVTSGARQIWQTTPRARSVVPLPGLPAYLASRVAVSPERSDEFERLLYKSARDQIDQKFGTALANMPQCPNRIMPR